jgi:hypothetical protein
MCCLQLTKCKSIVHALFPLKFECLYQQYVFHQSACHSFSQQPYKARPPVSAKQKYLPQTLSTMKQIKNHKLEKTCLLT